MVGFVWPNTAPRLRVLSLLRLANTVMHSCHLASFGQKQRSMHSRSLASFGQTPPSLRFLSLASFGQTRRCSCHLASFSQSRVADCAVVPAESGDPVITCSMMMHHLRPRGSRVVALLEHLSSSISLLSPRRLWFFKCWLCFGLRTRPLYVIETSWFSPFSETLLFTFNSITPPRVICNLFRGWRVTGSVIT